MRSSLLGRSARRICLTATASPVPQLKALYTDPKAPLPMQSPRRWQCGQRVVSPSRPRELTDIVLQARVLHRAHAVPALACLLAWCGRDLGGYRLAVGMVVGPVGGAAWRHPVLGAPCLSVSLMGASTPPSPFPLASSSAPLPCVRGRGSGGRSYELERTLQAMLGHAGTARTGGGIRPVGSPSCSSVSPPGEARTFQ